MDANKKVDKIEIGWSEIETSQVVPVEVAIFWSCFKMVAIWLQFILLISTWINSMIL